MTTGIYLENGRRERVEEQVQAVQNRNNKLSQLESKLKAAQNAFREEQERCDKLQKLLLSRSATLRRVEAVRGSLIKVKDKDDVDRPCMWLTAWEPFKDKETGVEGARVTIRGWRDALNAVEAEVAKKLPGRAATSAEVVQMSLKKNGLFVEDSVKIVAQRDVKDCLSEFVISMTFAPEPSLAGDEQPAAGGKKKKGGR